MTLENRSDFELLRQLLSIREHVAELRRFITEYSEERRSLMRKNCYGEIPIKRVTNELYGFVDGKLELSIK